MSKSVDSRVVEMRFDNKEFETNAKQTLNTLNDLKKALDNNTSTEFFDSIDRASKNIDLSGIQSGIDAITDRFSTMGIVGMRVIENLTDAITGKLTSAINGIIGTIVEGGKQRALDVETARFQLHGILGDFESVNAVMKNVNQAVTGTAFGMDEAALAASQFAASGLKAGEEMQTALNAIAGVAATTSKSYEEIARIFTQVAGNGRLMGDQLLQLSVRGLNAAATLANYFNSVKENGDIASESVRQLINNLTGATDALEESGDNIYEKATKEIQNEYKLRQKTYQQEYKDLQKTLSAEYNAKKKSYDESYKLLQKSLNDEMTALQKSNSKRMQEANESYQADVDAYRKATNEKINLINEQYTESIKLIDEERYNKIKAIDDQIKGIRDQQKEEDKAREKKEEEDQRALLKRAVEQAQFAYTRQKAEEALAAFEEEVARKRLMEERQENIDKLNEEKNKINEEANLKKEEAAKKRQSAIDAVQEESQAKLEAMRKAHEEEIELMREQQQASIEALRETNNVKLEALREQQAVELAAIKEAQSAQLEAKKEAQSDSLSSLKASQKEELEILKETLEAEGKFAGAFSSNLKVTESDIREMVSQGLISFDLFAEAMEYTFGKHAKDANNTFTGVMSNIRAALKKIGEEFYKPFIEYQGNEQRNPMIEFLNTIMKKLNELKDALAPVAEAFTSFVLQAFPLLNAAVSKLTFSITEVKEETGEAAETFSVLTPLGEAIGNVFKIIGNIFLALGSIIKPVIDGFKEIFSISMENFVNGVENVKEFTASLRLSEIAAKLVKSAFKGVFSVFKLLKAVVTSVLKVFQPLLKLFGTGTEDVLEFTGGIGDLALQFANWLEKSEAVNAVIQVMSSTIGWFVDKVLRLTNVIGGALTDAFSDVQNVGSYFSEGFLIGVNSFIGDVVNAIFDFGKKCIAALMNAIDAHSPSEETKKVGGFFMEGFLQSILELSSTVIDTVMDVFTELIDTVWDFFTNIDYIEIAESAIEGAKTFITSMAESIANGVDNVIDDISHVFGEIAEWMKQDKTGENGGKNLISTFISGMWSMITTLFKSLITIITATFKSIKDHLNKESIKEAWEIGKKFASDFAEGLITNIKEWLKPIGDAFEWVFGNIDFGSLAAMTAGVGVLLLLLKVLKMLSTVVAPISELTGVMGSLSKALRSFAFDVKATAILKIAAAIGILCGSVALLYNTFGDEINWSKFAAVGLTIIGLLSIVGIIFIKMSEIAAKSEPVIIEATTLSEAIKKGAAKIVSNISAAIKSLARAASFGIIIKAFTKSVRDAVIAISLITIMLKKDEKTFAKATVIFSAIATAVLTIVSLYLVISSQMGKTASTNIKNVSLGILSIAASVLIIAMAIKKIINIKLDFKKDKSKLVMLAALFTVLIVVINALVKVNNKLEENDGTLKLGLIVGFCVLVIASIHALKKLIKMGATLGKNYKQLILLSVIFALVTGVVVALTKTVKTIGKEEKIANIGNTLFGFCAMTIVTMAAIAILSKMKFTSYIKGLVMVAGVFGALLLVCKAAGEVQDSDGYKSITAISVVIGVLMIAIGALSMIKLDKLLAGTAAISTALLAFAGVLHEGTKYAEGMKLSGIAAIFVMILSIVFIGNALYKLRDIPWDNLLASGTAISSCMLALGKVMKDISSIEADAKQIIANIFIIGEGIIAIYLIGSILKIISKDVKWDEITSTAASISTCMLAMGKAMGDVNEIEANAKDLGKNAIVIIEGLIYMAVVALILNIFSRGIEPKNAIAMAASISMAILAMAKSLDVILDSENTWKNVGMLGGIIAEGLIAVAAIGKAIQETSKGADWKSLVGMGVAIAVVLISIGVVARICAPLGSIAKEALIGLGVLDLFIGDLLLVLGGFGLIYEDPSIRRVFESGGEFLISIGEILGKFAGAIVDGFLDKSSEALIPIGNNLSRFMKEAQPFFDALSKLDDDVGRKAGILAGIIIKLAGAEFINSLTQLVDVLILGNWNPNSMGDKLVAFGKSVVEFSDVTKDIKNVDHLQAVTDVAKAMVDMASEIKRSGGIIDNVFGNADIDRFGRQFISFAAILPAVAEKFGELGNKDLRKIKKVSEVIVDLANAAKQIDNSGGMIDQIFGSNDIDLFGKQFNAFTVSLCKASKNIKHISDSTYDKIKPIAESITSLAQAAKQIGGDGGFWQAIFGDHNMGKFGKQLLSYTKSMASVSDIVKKVDIIAGMKGLGKSLSITRKVLVDMKKSFGKYHTLGKHLNEFTDDLLLYSNSVKTVCSNMKSSSLSVLDHFRDTLDKMSLIKYDFIDDFKYYEKTKFKSFFSDLRLYLDALYEVFDNKMKFSNINYLTNLHDTIAKMYLISLGFQVDFKKYIKTKLNTFLNDLKLYLDSLVYINDTMNGIDLVTSLSKLTSSISIMNKIKTIFESLGEYTTGKIKKFLKDVLYFTDAMVSIGGQDLSNALSNVLMMSLSIEYMKKLHTAFIETFAEYTSVNFSWFMEDLKSYASILNYISGLNISQDTLWSLYYTQETFKYINYIRYQMDTLFDKYKTKRFDTFVDDLRTYASALNTITGMNLSEDTLYSLYYTQETFKYINYIQYQMSNMFKEYKTAKFDTFINDFNVFVSSMNDLSSKTFDYKKFQEIHKMSIVLPFIKGRFEEIGRYVRSSSFEDFCFDFTRLVESMESITNFNLSDFTAKTTAIADATNRFLNLLPQLSAFEAQTFVNFLRDLIKYGTDSLKGFLAAFNNSKTDVDKVISKMFGYVISAITDKQNLVTSAGLIIIKYITNGMNSEQALGYVTSAIQEVLRTIMVYVKNNDGGAYIAGMYVVKGFVRGIQDHLREAERAGSALGRAAYEAAQRSLSERSPSRVMMKIGSYAGEGFVMGLKDWIGAASEAGTEFGETTLDSMKEAINKLSSEIQNEDDFNPTITPILDLSSIEENANLIGSMLNIDKPIQLAANAGLSFSGGLNNLLEGIQAAIPDNATDDVVDAINDLRSDMAIMNQRLTNMQVVMDSGELVGALVEPLDQQMGFNATLVERGVR